MAKITGLVKRGNVYWFQRMVEGKRLRVSLGTNDLNEAILAIRAYRSVPHLPKTDTIKTLKEAFLEEKKREDRFTESTQVAAAISLDLLGRYVGGLPVSAISTKRLQAWFDAKRRERSEATAQTHLARVRGFFKWCVQKKLLVNNPAAAVRLGRVSKRSRLRFCSAAERDHLIAGAVDHDMKVILFLGFFGGLRRGEIVEARRDWIDRKAGTLSVKFSSTFRAKDREERTIPLAKPFAEFLATFSPLSEFLIGAHKTVKGRSLYRYDFRQPFAAHVAKCGLPWVTPHVMRHTFASLLASSGVSIYKIALWLGDDVRVVQRHYAKLLPGDRDIDRM